MRSLSELRDKENRIETSFQNFVQFAIIVNEITHENNLQIPSTFLPCKK